MYNFIYTTFVFLAFYGYKKSFNLNRLTSFLIVCVFFILVFIIGARYDSVDYFGYLSVFNRVDFSGFGFPFYNLDEGMLQTTGNEFLFATLTSFFRLFDIDPVWWFSTIAALSLGVRIIFYRKNAEYFWIAFFLYICFAFGKEISQIRNALAIGILLFAMNYTFLRKPWRFVIFSLIASGIHIFSLAILPMYYLGRAGKYKVIYILMFVFTIFSGLMASLGLSITKLFFFIHPAVASKLSGYLSSGGYQLGGLFYANLFTSFLIFAVGFLWKQREEYYVFASFSFVGLAGYAIFGEAGELGNRFLDTFAFSVFPLLASFMLNDSPKSSKSYLFFYWLAFGTIIYFAKMSSQAPYQNLLWM